VCHVLIIEDEPLIAMLIEEMLEEEGATSLDIAATQDDAVALALAHPPDVITSDVRLLQGTGPLAVAEILTRLGHRPVIYITANPDACEPRAASSVILPKPLYAHQLRQAFQAVC
jgi:CheY-like chemotaxis protein